MSTIFQKLLSGELPEGPIDPGASLTLPPATVAVLSAKVRTAAH